MKNLKIEKSLSTAIREESLTQHREDQFIVPHLELDDAAVLRLTPLTVDIVAPALLF